MLTCFSLFPSNLASLQGIGTNTITIELLLSLAGIVLAGFAVYTSRKIQKRNERYLAYKSKLEFRYERIISHQKLENLEPKPKQDILENLYKKHSDLLEKFRKEFGQDDI